MPTELDLEIRPWIAPDPRHVVLQRVRRRGRALRWQRRLPATAATLAAVAVLAAAALPGGGSAAHSVRTADDGGDHPILSEEHTVDAGPAEVSAAADVYAATGTGTGAKVSAQGSAGGQQGGQTVTVNPRPTTSLDGHPLFTDPRDEVADSPRDIVAGDITLEGDDELVFRIEVVKLSAFRSGQWGPGLGITFGAVAFGDMRLDVRTSLDTTLQPSAGAVALGQGFVSWVTDVETNGENRGVQQAQAEVDTTVEVNEKRSAILFRVRLADINEAVRSNNAMAARRAQGDVTFQPGTRLGRLVTSVNSGGVYDVCEAPADRYWAIGD